MYRILVVEDDEVIAENTKKLLESWNYEALCAKDFENVLKEFALFNPQLVLMDINLPFQNGFYWCSEIRKISSVPIIFLTSISDNMNIVMAMNMGGDDYMEKPYDPMVLTAKIRAVLRRTYELAQGAELYEHNGAMFSPTEAWIRFKDGKVELTKNENRIIMTLMENKGKVVSRDAIMVRLWENDEYVDDNTLTVNINRLRKKLEAIGLEDFIITKKGLGYKI
ncbi:MAG: response regulator transcription factor [Lachnospiraceae bacterium]|nr:response regulator transcription factor [Lachnospiraceae bacterium]